MLIRWLGLCLLVCTGTLVTGQSVDDLIKDVFGEDPVVTPETRPTPPPATPPPVPTAGLPPGPDLVPDITRVVGGNFPRDTDGPCECVEYYLCPNGTILTDGSGLLDIRISRPVESCPEYSHVCCKEPPLDKEDAIKPTPYIRQGCGQRRVNGVGFRITGNSNNEAQFGEFPWMVALLKRTILEDNEELMVYQCGGALIHERVVLTAAHCVVRSNEQDESEILIRAGEWDTQRTNEIFPYQNQKVIRVITHPGFKPSTLANDYALLLLEEPFTLNDNVDTVCLPPPGVVPLSRECYVSGWGKDQFGKKGQYQVILKKIDMPIVPKEQCINLLRQTRLGKFYRLHDSFVCAGGIPGKDACKGDGGGPLVCPIEGRKNTYEVTGLVAWGIGCNTQTPGVYAGVAYSRNWIDQNLAELGIQIEQ